uniref:CSON014209 protein n=1 Tax=Culicoides sonorensis TaxID=179676 RepID=A0A336KS59_CULSO
MKIFICFTIIGLFTNQIQRINGYYQPLAYQNYFNQQQYQQLSFPYQHPHCQHGYNYCPTLNACKPECVTSDFTTTNCNDCKFDNAEILFSDTSRTSDSFYLSPVPDSTTKFYCFGKNQFTVNQCVNGTVFDNDQKKCVPQTYATNLFDFQQEVGVSNIHYCYKEGTFALPQPNGDCSYFYTCKKHVTPSKTVVFDQTIYRCADQRRFNPATKSCSYLAQCKYDCNNEFTCLDNGLFRHPIDCQTYYYCRFDVTQGVYVAHTYSCHGNTIFDSCTRSCKEISDASECKYLPLEFQKVV